MRERLPGIVGLAAATLAASCCILPIALIATGLASAGLMMTMMHWEWLTLPLGVCGLLGAFLLYRDEERRCDAAGCHLVGRRLTRALLLTAAIIVMATLLLRLFPAWSSRLIAAMT